MSTSNMDAGLLGRLVAHGNTGRALGQSVFQHESLLADHPLWSHSFAVEGADKMVPPCERERGQKIARVLIRRRLRHAKVLYPGMGPAQPVGDLMKKTLRLIALAGVIVPALLITERPGYAIMSCSEKDGRSCSSTPGDRCVQDDYPYAIVTCECVYSLWSCY